MSFGPTPPDGGPNADCSDNASHEDSQPRAVAPTWPDEPRWSRHFWQRPHRSSAQFIGVHPLRDVFDILFPEVVETVGEPVADMIAHRARDAEPSRLRQCLQPRGDVDAVAVNVAAVSDDVAEIDPDAKGNAFVLGHLRAAVRHCPLDLDGAAHRIDDAGKFHQHPVAGGLDDAPVMLPDLRVDERAAMRFQAVVGALLIRPHPAAGAPRKPPRRSRGYGLTRSSSVIGDAAVDECAPFGTCQPRPFEA